MRKIGLHFNAEYANIFKDFIILMYILLYTEGATQ